MVRRRPFSARLTGFFAIGMALTFAQSAAAQSVAPSSSPTPGASSEPEAVAPSPVPDDAPAVHPPVAIPFAPEPTGSLHIDAAAGAHATEIEVESGGRTLRCDQPVSPGHPCELRDLAMGDATVRVRGVAASARTVTITAAPAHMRVTYTAARNAILPGIVLVVAGLALGAGTVVLTMQCMTPGSCVDDAWEGYAIPMGLMTLPVLALGVWLMTWHRGEQRGVETVESSPPVARRITWQPLAAATPAGAMVGVRFGF